MKLVALIALAPLASCDRPPVYTLYRNSSVDSSMRIHWASFNANDTGAGSNDYNRENCEQAVDLLRANLRTLNGGVEPVRFWCEKGPFHK